MPIPGPRAGLADGLATRSPGARRSRLCRRRLHRLITWGQVCSALGSTSKDGPWRGICGSSFPRYSDESAAVGRPTLPWQFPTSPPRRWDPQVNRAHTLATCAAQPGRSCVGLTPGSSSPLPLGQDRVWVSSPERPFWNPLLSGGFAGRLCPQAPREGPVLPLPSKEQLPPSPPLSRPPPCPPRSAGSESPNGVSGSWPCLGASCSSRVQVWGTSTHPNCPRQA